MKTQEQALSHVLYWAKTACADQRAQLGVDDDDDEFIPSWLPELEGAIEEAENEGAESLEP